jgi:hypothetical protein
LDGRWQGFLGNTLLRIALHQAPTKTLASGKWVVVVTVVAGLAHAPACTTRLHQLTGISGQCFTAEELLSSNISRQTLGSLTFPCWHCVHHHLFIRDHLHDATNTGFKGKKSDKLAQRSCRRTYQISMHDLIYQNIGIWNSFWKFGKDDGLLWTLRFCYLSLLWDDNHSQNENPTSLKVPIKVYAYITMLFLDVQEHWLLGPEILINESTFHFAKVVELSKTEPNNKPWSVQLINKIRDIDNDCMM